MLHIPKQPVILVIGSNGQVGWELLRTLAPLGRVIGADLNQKSGLSVDMAKSETIATLLKEVRPAVIVNAAAYTAVDRAEQETDLATAINAEAVGKIGSLAASMGIPVVHYSTDFVFSGDSNRPYQEDDPTGPLGVYGASKLAGEQALATSGAVCLTFRTSWVYGVRGQNFLLTMRCLLRERQEVWVVDDQTGSPTWSRLLAEVTAQILGCAIYGGLDLETVQGLYHLSGSGSTTWYGFARAIHKHYNYPCRLLPITSQDYPTPASRPTYSILDNSKLQQVFGLTMPNWQESLAQCLSDLGS